MNEQNLVLDTVPFGAKHTRMSGPAIFQADAVAGPMILYLLAKPREK